MPGRPTLLHVFPTFVIGGAQSRFARIADATGTKFRHVVLAIDGRYDARGLMASTIETLEEVSAKGSLFERIGRYRRRIRKIAPDLLLTNNWGAIEWALAGRLTGVPHIHAEDGFGAEEADRQLVRRVWFRRLALHGALATVVPSRTLERLATEVWRLPEGRVLYIPNGIEVSAIPPDGDRITREMIGLPEDRPVIVWVGALRREKNVGRLLRAFAKVAGQAHLALIGEGRERAAIEAEIRELGLGDRVHLLGRRYDVPRLLPLFDALALSSDTEQMPVVVLEAMAAGLPVASVDVGDVRAMVSAENQAFVVPRSEEDLAAALSRLIASGELGKRAGSANRLHVQKAFPERGMIDRYVALYDQAVAQGQGQRSAPKVASHARLQ